VEGGTNILIRRNDALVDDALVVLGKFMNYAIHNNICMFISAGFSLSCDDREEGAGDGSELHVSWLPCRMLENVKIGFELLRKFRL